MKKLQFILHVLAIVVLVTGGTIIATSSTAAQGYPCCDTVDCEQFYPPNAHCIRPDPYRSENNQTCNPGQGVIYVADWCAVK